MQLVSACGARYSLMGEKIAGSHRLSMGIWGIGILFIMIGVWQFLPAVILIVFFHALLWGASTPFLLDKIQQYTSSDIRATTLSVGSMIARIITIGLTISFGWIADHFSLNSAFVLLGGFFFIATLLIPRIPGMIGKMTKSLRSPLFQGTISDMCSSKENEMKVNVEE